MTNIEITGSEATEIQGEDLDKVVGGRSSFDKIRRKKRKGRESNGGSYLRKYGLREPFKGLPG